MKCSFVVGVSVVELFVSSVLLLHALFCLFIFVFYFSFPPELAEVGVLAGKVLL